MVQEPFSSRSFLKAAEAAIELVLGARGGDAGAARAGVRELALEFGLDLGGVLDRIAGRVARVAPVHPQAFARLGPLSGQALEDLTVLSGTCLAIESAELALAASQLDLLGGEASALDPDLRPKAGWLSVLRRFEEVRSESIVEAAAWMFKPGTPKFQKWALSPTSGARLLVELGQENLAGGDPEDVFVRFLRAVERDPTCYEAHSELGEMYEEKEDYDKAEEHHRRAVSSARDRGALEVCLGLRFSRFLERRGRLRDSAEQLTGALSQPGLDEWRRDVWRFHLAELLAESEPDRAVEILRELASKGWLFHHAAMGSELLEALQPRIVELLVELASARRQECLAALQAIVRCRRAIGIGGGGFGSVRTLDLAAVKALGGALELPFQDLPSAVSSAKDALGMTVRRVVVGVKRRVDALADELTEIGRAARRDWRSMWPERPPDLQASEADQTARKWEWRRERTAAAHAQAAGAVGVAAEALDAALVRCVDVPFGGQEFIDRYRERLRAIIRSSREGGALFKMGPVFPCSRCGGLMMVSGVKCPSCEAMNRVWQDPEAPFGDRRCKNCELSLPRPGPPESPRVVVELMCPACGVGWKANL